MTTRQLGRFSVIIFSLALAVCAVRGPALAQRADVNTIVKSLQESFARGDYAAAQSAAEKLEQAMRAQFGTNHVNYAAALLNLGTVAMLQGKYPEAEGFYRRALAIKEQALGANHLEVAQALNLVATLRESQGKYAEAEGLHRRALAIREQALGANHPDVAETLVNLGNVDTRQSKYAEAEGLHKRAVAIFEKALGANHPNVAKALSGLAVDYLRQGRYVDAEGVYKRALAIYEQTLGANHPDVATFVNTLAGVYRAQGKYAEAEGLCRRALAIREQAFGSNHPAVAETLGNLAAIDQDQGKYVEAEGVYKRALAISEQALGANHPDVANYVNNLAALYRVEGRYAEAEALYKRALAIKEQTLGANHPDVAAVLGNLGVVYEKQSKHAEAEAFFKRAQAIEEQALGANHPTVAQTLGNLGVVYEHQGKHAEAQGLYQRALSIYETAFGGNHPAVADTLDNLAGEYQTLGKYAEAERLYRRALAIREQALGPNHPAVAETFEDLAVLFGLTADHRQALDYSRKATAAVIAHASTDAGGAGRRGRSGGLVEQRADYFVVHVANLAIEAPEAAAGQEAIEVAQWAIQSSTGAAVQQMAARFASGSGALGTLVRESQDLTALWRERDEALTEAVSKPDDQRSQSAIDDIRRQITAIEGKLAANAARLEKEFPDYAALANPKPLPADEARKLLQPDDALVFFLAGDKESYVFALTREDFTWKTIPLGAQALSQKVSAFRHGLDVDVLGRGLGRVECTQAEADRRGLSRIECDQALAGECAAAAADDRGLGRTECRHELFDLAVAYELYVTLLGPVEALVKDKQNLLVVPSGALTALPFHLLVTEKPAVAMPASKTLKDLAVYRDAAWLLKRQAVTVLPSVTSLKALRVFARQDQAAKPIVGFGDPVFNLDELKSPAGQRAPGRDATQTRGYSEFWQGVEGDPAMLSSLPRLADTADELKAIAKDLGAAASDIHLRADASVTTVKLLPLADYRIVYFATHGLVAGDVKGLSEPSLALTMPPRPSDFDNGLLTASEVAQLRLNADWVVLSACNTIAGDKPGAEALSGLARAFFYSGARALLVSHWSVDSNAATRLTTSTFEYLKADPTIGRAQALRRAMLAYLNDASNPRNAYPAYWAPFELVGEGAAQATLDAAVARAGTDAAERAWAEAKDSKSEAVLEAFISRFGDTSNASLARGRLAEVRRLAAVAPPVAPSAPGSCREGPTAVSWSSRAAQPLSGAEECALKAKDVFKECDKCPEMVVVPSGSFAMGSPSIEIGRSDEEDSQHPVAIGKAFAVGKFHVTVDQFAAFVADTGYDAGSKCWTQEEGKAKERDARWWRNPGFPQDGSHPAVCLSWNDAKAYVGWLIRKTGKSYRLLTEAEWEYAARAGTTTRYFFGEEESELCRYGNGADQIGKSVLATVPNMTFAPCSDGHAYTSPVGNFSPNGFGLYDMLGNAVQWLEDCWHKNYQEAPPDGSAWTTGDCSVRSLRGGSWFNNPKSLRAAARFKSLSSIRASLYGFRVARTL